MKEPPTEPYYTWVLTKVKVTKRSFWKGRYRGSDTETLIPAKRNARRKVKSNRGGSRTYEWRLVSPDGKNVLD